MHDHIAIQQTINLYTEGASRADWDQVIATFLPGGIWEIAGGGVQSGHDAIRAAMAAFVSQMAYYVQLNAPAVIHVEGDRATARSVIRECGKYADRDSVLDVVGFYNDELVRTPDGWRFARRTFRAAGMRDLATAPTVLGGPD